MIRSKFKFIFMAVLFPNLEKPKVLFAMLAFLSLYSVSFTIPSLEIIPVAARFEPEVVRVKGKPACYFTTTNMP